jgi:hypothetical protein
LDPSIARAGNDRSTREGIAMIGRLPAAALSAGLTVGALALLYWLGVLPAIDWAVHVRMAWDPTRPGLTAPLLTDDQLRFVLAWGPGPVAAALFGLLLADRAARRDRLVGVWLGFLTYVAMVVVGSFIAAVSRELGPGQIVVGQAALDIFVGAPLEAVAAGAVLAPLLITCVVSGSVWALIVGRLEPSPPRTDAAQPWTTRYAPALVLAAIVVTGGWALVVAFIRG